ncbi:phenylalanyl-tRNA synthetase beta subunit [Schinkia azotoformans MEV2011]|uniref:Phenylalanine--tRNA ligase beta subunit n=1 Tax=Schinkia azotoformans MEV2011 TaxID=1348973 RepID=A0A072NPE6_SCHAZ|nr:phenylalanine--tRNA ligase subunit beta [Schinkia azotoformans]KEF39539.1 phenylalanyl-tRNA synthetase beta subunit [Schinkia azotoformans MEV2011]MEC1694229.1 phenylalanine--tRNA ligase subunit beta [Schinkia azotoformans]MEC1723557.1 phenylalanine--tRNA ligase subunit beta [Schinkia azotoformans]MEC1740204.1 phenylalanine--tRNA ligase subunit beta [Schinkia azotoformans]MEC1759577.1 phenylalanine--tRNA ligase subunit beta [Schinkia azotoformans]
MLVSYNWLKDYVDINDVSAEELAEKITKAGIEVEQVEVLNKGIEGVVVGHVLECSKHPEADKLNICQVDLGEEEPKQIICGAPNVAAGQKVIVAKIGAVLPGNFKIKKAKLRGEASNGMICSLQELGIETKFVPKEYATGIFVFPFEVEVGSDPLEYLNLNDKVLELSLTPNRSDALSMLGVAYEVAAILSREVKLPKPVINEVKEKAADYIKITIDAKEDCPYYAARVVKGVKIGPSPLWMQMRLMAAGIRPINNVVDITNYILIEYGQPLHAFDYDRLGSKEILVRRAKQDEKFVTLDDQERTLKDDQLVITNGTEPIALAGVMGGANSEVHDGTVNVLIEAAVFKGLTVRKASKDHGLRSEASARFEKGIDPERTKEAGDRAAALMAELAGGEVLEGVVAADYLQSTAVKVSVSTERINQVLGTSITTEEVANIFTRLQFDFTEENGNFTVTAPSRRRDIVIPEDLIEEVARLYGYDFIPTTLPVGDSTPGKLSQYQQKRRKVRKFLEGAGLSEAVTYSLTSSERAMLYKDDTTKATPIRLSMPMSEERSTLRLSLVPHLLEAVAHNNARQLDDVALYEIGKVYLIEDKIDNEQPNERENLAGAITGLWHSHSWQGEKKAVDFFVAKGILEGLFDVLGLNERITFEQGGKDGLHPGRTAIIKLDGDYIGFVGQVHPDEQKALDLDPTYVYELNLEKLLRAEVKAIKYEAIPRYPSITRDIALVVDDSVIAGNVEEVIKEAGGPLLKEVSIFDLYQGEHLEKGKKSLAFSLRYFDPEKTLTDEEVSKAHEKVLQAVAEKLGAVLRG